MSHTLPRVALGTVGPATELHPILWALLDHLDSIGVQVQTFSSQACFDSHDGTSLITGRRNRHLDNWIMSSEVCAEVLNHGALGADLAIVDGCFDRPKNAAGGCLESLATEFHLARIGILNIRGVDPCQLRRPSAPLDALLLDGPSTSGEAAAWRMQQEALWGVPVLGYLEHCPHVRAILDRLPCGARPSRELCRALGEALVLRGGVDSILDLSGHRPPLPKSTGLFSPGELNEQHMAGLTVAVAYDEAFSCYFPDTLDLMESAGAEVKDFSPLSDEAIPADADVVYLGCGNVHRLADRLAGNQCMMFSLRQFARAGGRIYAEGGGLAYLCRRMEVPCSGSFEMAGLLPATARMNAGKPQVFASSVCLAHDCWLGRAGRELRGYANDQWHIETDSPLVQLTPPGRFGSDLIGIENVIGSRLHLSLVGQPHLLRNFLTASVI